eukprot:jgi/Psemu1/33757/gm1.33757_g
MTDDPKSGDDKKNNDDDDDDDRPLQLLFTDLAFATKPPNQNDNDNDNWIRSDARCPFAVDRHPVPTKSHLRWALHSCVAAATTTAWNNNNNNNNNSNASRLTMLNVEFFGEVSWPNMVCFVPGVCESAETKTVQHLARICRSKRWRLAVVELEGHGLSDGRRGVLLPGDRHWDRYVDQVVRFCAHALATDRLQKQKLKTQEQKQKQKQQQQQQQQQKLTTNTNTNTNAQGAAIPTTTRFVLAGASLGGALAVYASQKLLASYSSSSESSSFDHRFVGTLLLSPAVGIAPSAVPPPWMVTGLSVLAGFCPSVGIPGVTPTEDPSHYEYEYEYNNDNTDGGTTTTRNFAGPWPLGTSKLLLDVVSRRIPSDVADGSLNLCRGGCDQERQHQHQHQQHAVWVVTGGRDPVVPASSVRDFVEGMRMHVHQHQHQHQHHIDAGGGEGSPSPSPIELIEIPKGDHGLLVGGSKTQNKTLTATTAHVVDFLNHCEALA